MPTVPLPSRPDRPTASPRPYTAALLATKLNPPALQPGQVPRDAICQRIVSAGGAKLVLVRAPAGFGKTTAMVQARDQLHAAGVDTAWLTLDRADNDVPRFLRCLHQAVIGIVGEARAPASAEAPLALLAALADHGTPFALFLDDFELITEPAVLSLVREILTHLPRRGQLVLGSRSLPDLGLGLARLRTTGQLLEIDATQLRFTLDETGRFFAGRAGGGGGGPLGRPPGAGGSALDPAALQQLHARTEGWVAALWLASMALERATPAGGVADFIDRFNGSDRAVADYLAEDVLARQPPELRQFLLRTSILRHLNAPLCQALVPRQDAARVLARLDAAQLFITPIAAEPGDAGQAWRYHSLFADFLRAQLERELPDEVARLHLAASGWYEAQGRPVPAIDHALEGGDAPHALHLLSQHAEAFLEQGRMRLLARWFAAVPPAHLAAHPELQMVALWAITMTRGPWDALAPLDASGALHSPDPMVRAHAQALRPMLLAMMDRFDEAYAEGLQALRQLPTGQAFADSALANAMANALGVMGEEDEAQRVLDLARRVQQGSAFNRMYSESVAGLMDLRQGRLRQASARFRLALGAQPTAAAWLPTHGNAWAGVLHAATVYEADQPREAEHLLNVYLPLARDVGLPDHMIISHTLRARIAFGRGDVDAGLQVITELEYLGHHRQLPRVVASARLERARHGILSGQADAAAQELQRADDTAVWPRTRQRNYAAHDVDDLVIGRLRWQVHFGDAAAAARDAAALADEAHQRHCERRRLKLQVLQALAESRGGAGAAALATLTAAVRQAAAEGFVRLLLDEGEAVGPLLRRCQAAQLDGERALDPILIDHLERLLRGLPAEPDAAGARARLSGDAAGATTAGTPGPSGAPGSAGHAWPAGGSGAPNADDEGHGPAGAADGLAEPLTRKEIRVLQLLAEGYSNSALAEQLSVSDSTVRTHLRNINLKLDARSRTQAVAVARRLGLIG